MDFRFLVFKGGRICKINQYSKRDYKEPVCLPKKKKKKKPNLESFKKEDHTVVFAT